MGLFWVGFVSGSLVALLVLLVTLALCDHLVESDAQQVAREVREAK